MKRLLAAGVLAMSLSGCATTAMKGTPFFSGEYKEPRGPAEDRVNLWPITYYREPALSVLWPFIESVKGESFAFRPFYSVYDKNDEDKRQVNVLWPLIQTDHAAHTGRAVPFFWGDDYFTGFPLYWSRHRADGRSDLMIPLWWYDRDGKQFHFYTLLGLAGARDSGDGPGWYVFPLAGSFAHADGSRYRYELWPLAHQYTGKDGSYANALIPLWLWSRNPNAWSFFSLPWSQGGNGRGTSWQVLMPVYYNKRTADSRSFITLLGGSISSPDRSTWLVPLLLSGGTRDADSRSGWLAAGLAHWGRNGSNTTSYAIPFYYASSAAGGRRFYSLPWSNVRSTDGSNWQLVPPLYLHSENSGRVLTLTPLYASGRKVQDASSWRALIPLYYSEHDRNGDLVATLLGGYRNEAGGHAWMIYPLLMWDSRHGPTNDFWALAPLVHFHHDATNSRSHIVPVYYRNTETGTFVSPAYAHWRGSSSTNTLIPFLLSWRNQSQAVTDWWFLGGLGRYSSGRQAGPSYMIPLYYKHPRTGTVLSPVYCHWRNGQASTAVIPPVLGALTRSETGISDLWALAALYHHEWDGQHTLSDYLLPFYAYSPGNYFYTLLFGSKGSGGHRFAYYATPLVGSSREGATSSRWLFPLYGKTSDQRTGDAHGHFLWGFFNRTGKTSRSIFFPLYTYNNYGPKADPASTNAYGITGTEFHCLPWCWRNNTRSSFPVYGKAGAERIAVSDEYSHGAFPLWSYTRTHAATGEGTERASVLLLLYDSLRETTPLATTPGGVNDYTRKRFLWHVWHYEKLNGTVSVDMLPGITYDAKPDGFRQYSFLWRVFRWERDALGRRKLDLLFLPLLRDK